MPAVGEPKVTDIFNKKFIVNFTAEKVKVLSNRQSIEESQVKRVTIIRSSKYEAILNVTDSCDTQYINQNLRIFNDCLQRINFFT